MFLIAQVRFNRCFKFILVSQSEPTIDVYQKNDKNEWIYFDVTGMDKDLNMANKNVQLSDVYLEINFQEIVED